LQKEQNVSWILAISVILLIFTTAWLGLTDYPSPQYYRQYWTALENALFYVHRINILFFVATITTATLYTTGFEKKDLMFKVSGYLFTISMMLFFIILLKPVLT